MTLPLDKVLVTIGTPCSLSAVGSTETHRALADGDPVWIAHAAHDAGLVDVDLDRSTPETPVFIWATGERKGTSAAVAEISERYGSKLRSELGIRRISPDHIAAHLLTDIAAPLPHDLGRGGLRHLAGISFDQIRQSPLKDMFGLFDDDPRIGPSVQTQLFLYAGLGALASLPVRLHELLPDPTRFRVAAATAFHGLESVVHWREPMQRNSEGGVNDKFAFRLAGALASHGPALLSTMLAPPYNLSRVKRMPSLLGSLAQPGSPMRRVPQAPLTSMGACASSLIAFCELAPQMVLDYPGHTRPDVVLWTAADAALEPDFSVLEAFGVGAMMSQAKLDALNSGRVGDERRRVSDCLAPFDTDAQGTVVGNAGSGVVVTTLEFALQHDLDVTSIIAGWGQSGEAGGKGHFAGVGFGGENALIQALRMAYLGHGYSVHDFQHLVAHATGTRTNSKTDLGTTHAARVAAAEWVGGALQQMSVGAPKALGDGHSMGETGLKAVGEAIQYVQGHTTVGVPTLRHLDPDMGDLASLFRLGPEPVRGGEDRGALCATQGFGGYNGAMALRSANPEALRRYSTNDPKLVDRYLEKWSEIRRARVVREARYRRTRGAARMLAEYHQWLGA